MMKSIMTLKTSQLFMTIGIISLVACLYFFISTIHFMMQANPTTGKVIELDDQTASSFKLDRYKSPGNIYAPVVLFKTERQERVAFTTQIRTDPPMYKPGDVVDVLYLPDNPQVAKINTLFYLWSPALFSGVFAAIFIIVSIRTRKDQW